MTMSARDEGAARAEQILLGNGGSLGLLGSSQAYRQVWARDSMISALGLLLCEDPEGRAIHRRSLETLRRYQSPLGHIAHNIGQANLEDPALVAYGRRRDTTANGSAVVKDTTHAGVIDSNLWFIIGHALDWQATGDVALVREAWPSLQAALLWLRYQDVNECGLLEAHESMDWADLFANRYNTLYANVLYYAVWRAMAALAAALGEPAADYAEQAANVRRKINMLLWIGPEQPKDWEFISRERQEWLYTLKRIETELVIRPYYLPYVAFRDYADRLDTMGNLLAIVFGVADQTQADKILDYIQGCGLNEPYPVRALYPPIRPGEKDWRDYYLVRNLNLPDHYHNGGAWPYLGGFYVAALVRAGRLDEAARQLGKLRAMNRVAKQGEWGFNEWFHGLSGRPMGFDGQSWSAALYLYARDAVQRGELALLDWVWEAA